MSKRTLDASGLDEIKRTSSEEKKIKRLEMTLRIIRTWAQCWELQAESPRKAMDDIVRKCDEALR